VRIDPQIQFEKTISKMGNMQLFYLLQFVAKEMYRRLEPEHAAKMDADAVMLTTIIDNVSKKTGKEFG